MEIRVSYIVIKTDYGEDVINPEDWYLHKSKQFDDECYYLFCKYKIGDAIMLTKRQYNRLKESYLEED